MKNVLLINPAHLPKKGNIWKEISCAYPPLGLALAASLLEKNNIPVSILDLQVEPLDAEQLETKIKEINPQIIGLSSSTPVIKEAFKIAEIAKKALPEVKIVLGGVHATVMPQECIENKNIDIVARGESEYTFLELCTLNDLSKIDGITYKTKEGTITNKDREPVKYLDELPFPAYHLLPMHKYKPALGTYKRLPAMIMLTSRGCPGRCTFCYSGIKEKNIRTRSEENVIAEIKFLKEKYGIKEINFYDDVFTLFRNKVVRLCNTIIKERLDITWSCMSRINLIDKELLNIMKKAGCHSICYGIESADETILKNIQKFIDLNKAREVIKLTKEVGIEVRISLMFGNPGETEETMEKTINFALETDPDVVLFNIATAYPGTEMYTDAKAKGYLIERSWEEYDLANYTLQLQNLSEEKIKEYYKKAYRRFYFRPSYILKRLSKIRSFTDIKENIEAFKGIFGFIKA